MQGDGILILFQFFVETFLCQTFLAAHYNLDQPLLLRFRAATIFGPTFWVQIFATETRSAIRVVAAPRQIRCRFKKEKSSVWRRFFLLNICFGEWSSSDSFFRDFGGWWVGKIVWQLQVRRRKKWQPVCYQWKRQRPGPKKRLQLEHLFLILGFGYVFFCFNKVASTKIKNCNIWHFVFHLFHLFNKTTETMALLSLKHLRRWSQ